MSRAVLLLWLLVSGLRLQQPSPDAAALLAELDRAEPEAARGIATEIVRLGEDAACAAVDEGEFPSGDLRARRARSWILVQAGGDACIRAATALLADEDAEVRRNALAFLSGPERGAVAELRARAIEDVAADDVDAGVAFAALQALARIDDPQSTAALSRLIEELVPPQRGLAARALASQARARGQVVDLVQRSFARDTFTPGVPDDVLEELLSVYGERLAELPQGGTARLDRVPFVQGVRHPSPEVRRVARLALDRFVARLRVLGDFERLDACLAALIGEGLDDANLRRVRTTMALEEGDDPEAGLAAARELRARTNPSSGGVLDRSRHAEACLMEAAALIALGRGGASEEPLAAARRTLEGLVAERLDLRGSDRLELVQVTLLEMLAQVELTGAARLLFELESDDPRVLERARAAHERALEAHLVLVRASFAGTTKEGLDRILASPLGPFALILRNPRNPELPRARSIDIEHLLCRALATVAPAEMPGFEPASTLERRLASPLEDPPRRALLQRIQTEVYLRRDEYLRRLEDRAREDPSDLEVRVEYQRTRAVFKDMRSRDERDGATSYLRLRRPSDRALVVGAHLREDGRFTAGRALAEKMAADLLELESTRAVSRLTYQDSQALELLKARADMAIGNAWMDEDRPDLADELLNNALQRLEVLESNMAERGESRAVMAQVEVFQADALVSLAVNANVKLREQERAVAYFERAWELREDDFMRVLLACYRARAGRDLEARDALRDVPMIPANYYNLACTYALLGEDELALDFLRRDFEEMRPTPGALARQKEWARADPDLESLRGDPRFEELVRDEER